MLVLINQDFQIAQITTNVLIARQSEQIANLRRMDLTIAIHPAISLLEDHQRPGNVEVNKAVSLVMQVETFGSHIRGDQQAQRRMGFTEIFDSLLDILVGQLTMQNGNGIIFESQSSGQFLLEEFQGFHTFGENH
ncbi:hypothetical protein D3C76_1075810 [compost metagenome]